MFRTSNVVSDDGALFMYCCWHILTTSDQKIEKPAAQQVMKKNFPIPRERQNSEVLEESYGWYDSSTAMTSFEKEWMDDLHTTTLYSRSDEDTRHYMDRTKCKGYILLNSDAFKDVKLPSSRELIKAPVYEALNNYFDKIVGKKKLHDLFSTTLVMWCCHSILMSHLFDFGKGMDLVEKTMKENFSGNWKGFISARPSDEKAYDWTLELAPALCLLKMDAWQAQRKGSILLLNGALKKVQLPWGQELMGKPVAKALDNFFDRIAARTKTDISDEVKISYWRTYEGGQTGETIITACLSKELSLDIPTFHTIDTPDEQHQ
ncbi:hypothetical protein MMC14_009058 [Varicellaria rhodocarpa]|nr:hypothetical protein [Varicellaria rhodocarpa]